MNSVKVSVIIPVFNAEPYVADCIESLLRQSLQECEFIFVNDGSSDRSGEIMSAYARKDGRIKLLSQENQGVSAARNKGLDAATGEYVGFVDADDRVDEHMFGTLYYAAEAYGCDAVLSHLESETAGGKSTIRYPFPINALLHRAYIRRQVLPYFLMYDDLNSVVNKLFRRKAIEQRRIRFPVGVALGEDGEFSMQFMSEAASVAYIDYCGYRYREVAGSATRNTARNDYFARALAVYKSDAPAFYGRILEPQHIRALKSVKLIRSVMSCIHMYFAPSADASLRQRKQYIGRMIAHPCVKEALPMYAAHSGKRPGVYEKALIVLLQIGSVWGLYLLTAYSRFRNT